MALWSRLRDGLRPARCGSALALVHASPAFAQTQDLASKLNMQGIADIFLTGSLGLIAIGTTALYLIGQRRASEREAELTAELNETYGALHLADVFLSSEAQILVAWSASHLEPDIGGDFSILGDATEQQRLLAFGTWLPADQAQELDRAVETLRARGEGFRLSLTNLQGRCLEAEGRAVGGRAVLRIRDISGERQELQSLRNIHHDTLADLNAMHALLDAMPCPVWTRDRVGKLNWVNAAYARAVEARDGEDAVARKVELLDQSDRDASRKAVIKRETWRGRVHAVVAGKRNLMDVIALPCEEGSAGIAIDLSELDALRADLSRQMEAHRRTLDQLTTAVAIFDKSQHLIFHNAAYRHVWGLEQSFLDQNPSDSEILDRLRAERRLPEQADYRAWKADILKAYQAVETLEQAWYLPDGRTLRAVITPNPQGGVTYLFDDVTERFHLESRYNALMRVQGETLDTLREGVAVFGSDGRLKLHNPAFQTLWKLTPAALADQPHIDLVARECAAHFGNDGDWNDLRALVAGLHDARTGFARRLTRKDGSAIDCAAAPLPDGATLITFSDVTASVDVERALTDRNEALLQAEKIRNDFVHHVSYELRSPLTNIIGFIQLLAEGAAGPLNAKQLEYSGYIHKSSDALLAIINDILDLASIDAGAMELSVADVDIRDAINAAAEGLQDRLAESAINLQIVALDNVGRFRADEKRLRQVLFNLLSNAIGFSEPGQTVILAAMRRGDEIVFKVTDQGRGIPPEVIDRVFDRFETHTAGSRHRGAGLGLSMVRAFVELHGGSVRIESAPGVGTTVTCIFPAAPAMIEAAAEVA